MPRRLRLQANKLKAAKTRLQKALDREPTHDEIAAALELDIEAYQVLRRKVAAYHFVPMENLYDLQSEAPSPLEQYEERQKVELFTRLIQQLKERERLVLDLYFFRDLNLREIGDVLGLTEGRISQIKSGAIARLREMAAEAHAVTAAA